MSTEDDNGTPGNGGQDDEPTMQPSGPPSAADDNDDVVPRAELTKVISERKKFKQRAQKAEEQLAELKKNLPDDDSKPKDDAPDTGKAADTAMQVAFVDQLIRQAAMSENATNPDQVVALLRSRVRVSMGDDGKIATTFVDENGLPEEGSADAASFVKRFLARPGHECLVRSHTVPGSGAKPGVGTNTDTKPRTVEQFNQLPADERKRLAMEMTPEEQRAVLGTERTKPAGFL